MLKNFKSEFSKNVLVLIGSSGISQLIPFLILPILQRYFYSPKDFGLLSIYVSFSLMLAKFSTFSYEFAIVQQNTEKKALAILKGTFQILFITSILSFFVLSFLFFFVKTNFYVQSLKQNLFLIPITIFSFGFYQILRYWNNWKKKYSKIGSSMVVKSLSSESTKLFLGFLNLARYGLIIGRVTGEVFSFIYLLIPFIKNDYSKLKGFKRKDIVKELKANYKFPLYTMPSGLKGTMLNVIFITLFADYFGLEKTGIIGIAVSYIGVAFGIISQSFSQVFFKKINELKNHQLLSSLKKNVALLFGISLVVVIITLLIPNNIIVTILGKKWSEMMPVLKILIFSISISFVSSSVSFIYIRTNRQKEMLFFDIFHLTIVTLSIIVGYSYTHDFIQTLKFYVIAQSLYYSFAIFLSFYFVKKIT